jgi:hypothetical protein
MKKWNLFKYPFHYENNVKHLYGNIQNLNRLSNVISFIQNNSESLQNLFLKSLQMSKILLHIKQQ